jgi:hypothetical protein
MPPLSHATPAEQVILLPAAANLLCDPQFSSVKIYLMRFLFCHATFAWRDTFLHAAADFLLDPQFPQVCTFLFWWCSAARF